MPTAISGGSRIRTNIPAENAYNALLANNNEIALRQLRLSTGLRINSAADDVAGYITSRALSARNGALKAALTTIGDAQSVSSIASDAYDNISGLITQIKDAAASASSGALGTDEKIALAKSAYRLAQQIQTVADATVFGGKALIKGAFSGDWTIGYSATNNLLTIGIDLTTGNADFNVASNNFDLNATTTANFAGVSGLDLTSLNNVTSTDLGVFSAANISSTLTSLADALDNVSKAASYLGGITGRLTSQQALLQSQTTNYDAAISRIQDADVAQEQLALIKAQFLQQTSLISLVQANQAPSQYLTLFR
jgi:flagellin